MRLELGGADSARAVAERVIDATSVLLPGRDELLLLTGESDLDAAAAAMLRRPRMEVVAVKLGKRGARVYVRGERRVDVPAYAVTEVDPTGAGDCFDAAFVCGLLRGLPPADAARRATPRARSTPMAFGPMEGDISPATVEALMTESQRMTSRLRSALTTGLPVESRADRRDYAAWSSLQRTGRSFDGWIRRPRQRRCESRRLSAGLSGAGEALYRDQFAGDARRAR